MTLTKAEIAEHLSNDLAITKLVAKDMVDAIFEVIRTTLEGGDPVKISGFGNFEVRGKKKRPGRNPKTGEVKLVTARRVVSFKAGQKLKSRVQMYQGAPPDQPVKQ